SIHGDLFGVRFADTKRGWAIGAHGAFLLTADGGATWQARELEGSPNLLGVSAAAATRVLAGGGDGFVVSLGAIAPTPVLVANRLTDMRAALRAAGVSETSIGQPLADFTAADAELSESTLRVERGRLALSAPPAPPPAGGEGSS